MAPIITTLCRLSSRRPKVCERVVSGTSRGCHCRVPPGILGVTISPTPRWFLRRFARTLLSLGVEYLHWSSDTPTHFRTHLRS
jgi:hypothetical protein